jgi:hypothetical protein
VLPALQVGEDLDPGRFSFLLRLVARMPFASPLTGSRIAVELDLDRLQVAALEDRAAHQSASFSLTTRSLTLVS